MRTYEEAFAAARDGSPFSNGTEGYAWMENWCDRCVHDLDGPEGTADGCPLAMVALMGRTPAEWLEQPWRQIKGRPDGETAPVLGDKYRCIDFRDRKDPGPGYEPPPDPPLPGQGELIPAEPYAGTRMFVDVVRSAAPEAVSRG